MNGWRRIDALWIAIGVLLIAAGVHLYCSPDTQAGGREDGSIVNRLTPERGFGAPE